MDGKAEAPKPVKMTMRGGGLDGNAVTWGGVTDAEMNMVEACQLGVVWLKVTGGRLEKCDAYTAPPPPVEDPAIPYRWQMPKNGRRCKYDVIDVREPDAKYWSPSFTIKHLTGYNFTEENYRREAGKLESWGFECCRSRRGENGRFWELWYLPGLFMAEGELKRYLHSYCSKCGASTDRDQLIDDPNCPNALVNYVSVNGPCGKGTMVKVPRDSHENAKTQRALDFLIARSSFGQLDISVQRACMTID